MHVGVCPPTTGSPCCITLPILPFEQPPPILSLNFGLTLLLVRSRDTEILPLLEELAGTSRPHHCSFLEPRILNRCMHCAWIFWGPPPSGGGPQKIHERMRCSTRMTAFFLSENPHQTTDGTICAWHVHGAVLCKRSPRLISFGAVLQ